MGERRVGGRKRTGGVDRGGKGGEKKGKMERKGRRGSSEGIWVGGWGGWKRR